MFKYRQCLPEKGEEVNFDINVPSEMFEKIKKQLSMIPIKARCNVGPDNISVDACNEGFSMLENQGIKVPQHDSSKYLYQKICIRRRNKDKDCHFSSENELKSCESEVDDSVMPEEVDMVNNPTHYTSHPSGIECIEVTEHMTFCIGNAIKYLWRCGLKGRSSIEDLEKARWYIDREIKRRKGDKDDTQSDS